MRFSDVSDTGKMGTSGFEGSHSLGMSSGDSCTVLSESESFQGAGSLEVSDSSGMGASLGSKDSLSLGVSGLLG